MKTWTHARNQRTSQSNSSAIDGDLGHASVRSVRIPLFFRDAADGADSSLPGNFARRDVRSLRLLKNGQVILGYLLERILSQRKFACACAEFAPTHFRAQLGLQGVTQALLAAFLK